MNPTPRILSLSALGVVYGDIGTSPIYALRECFYGSHPFPPTETNAFGVLSLIFWALMIIISLKYPIFVMRADNHGEGGILEPLALLAPWRVRRHQLDHPCAAGTRRLLTYMQWPTTWFKWPIWVLEPPELPSRPFRVLEFCS